MINKREENYSKWYTEIIIKSGLAEFSGIRGFMIIKPYGFLLWEMMKNELDKVLKDTGHENVYFPILIPKSIFSKEIKHTKILSEGCAIITHSKIKKTENKKHIIIDPKSKLEEELVVRPTSESIIWNIYKRWIHSYRDLPILFNQWGNAVRWEMKTKLFLRTTEFLWQEGHTAHSNKEEAINEAKKILDIYTDFSENFLAIPVLQGIKPYMDKFHGSEYTYCIEALMQDAKSLQIATSHFLGQNFSKAFNVKFMNHNGKKEYAWGTSWGISTRIIGGLVMSHSDNRGLIIPPKIAPIQVVIIPILHDEKLDTINNIAKDIFNILIKIGIRVKYDNRTNFTPGWKFHEYEMKGVPIRINIGLNEIKSKKIEVFRRDTYEKKLVPINETKYFIKKLLNKIQKNIYEKAVHRTKKLTIKIDNYNEFKEHINNYGGYILAHWDGTKYTGKKIQEETEATIRCIPFSYKDKKGKCIYSGNPSSKRVVFSKSY
ncbi:proline--tRNA ligase [Blattabacterium cuenoti]|uniref:proline--tRNA ligase n=1 Tax=Blattabacterium cuenoti TaxID=1653831 RepID=UPI00163BD486|nr:proline--tRNA ligase [Blattabacterium cuenoti]